MIFARHNCDLDYSCWIIRLADALTYIKVDLCTVEYITTN